MRITHTHTLKPREAKSSHNNDGVGVDEKAKVGKVVVNEFFVYSIIHRLCGSFALTGALLYWRTRCSQLFVLSIAVQGYAFCAIGFCSKGDKAKSVSSRRE